MRRRIDPQIGRFTRRALPFLLTALVAAATLQAAEPVAPEPRFPEPGSLVAAISVSATDAAAGEGVGAIERTFRRLLEADDRYTVLSEQALGERLLGVGYAGAIPLDEGLVARLGADVGAHRMLVGEVGQAQPGVWRVMVMWVDVTRRIPLAVEWAVFKGEMPTFPEETLLELYSRLITAQPDPSPRPPHPSGSITVVGNPLLPPPSSPPAPTPEAQPAEPMAAAEVPSVEKPPLEPQSPPKSEKPTTKPQPPSPGHQRQVGSDHRLIFGFIEKQVFELFLGSEFKLVEKITARGVSVAYERILVRTRSLGISKEPDLSIFFALHYGLIDEVEFHGTQITGGTSVDASGDAWLLDVGLGYSWFPGAWRHHVFLAGTTSRIDYGFADLRFSQGAETRWRIEAWGISVAYDFEFMWANGLLLGGQMEYGDLTTVHGSRIDRYEDYNAYIDSLGTLLLTARIGYAW